MTFNKLFAPTPALRANCPFCPGVHGPAGRLCNLCRRDALLRGEA